MNSGLTVYAMVNFPGNCSAATAGIFRAGSTVKGNTSRVSVIVGVNVLGSGECSSLLTRVGTVGTSYNSGVLGIVVRAYLLSSSRGVGVYRVISRSNTSFVGASANFSVTNTAFSSVELFTRRMTPRMEVGTTNNVSDLGSTRSFVGLNTDHLKADEVMGVIGRRSANRNCWLSGPACGYGSQKFHWNYSCTQQPFRDGICYEWLP